MKLPPAITRTATLFNDLSLPKRITLVSVVVASLVGFAFLMLWSSKPDYQLLYANLEPDDAGAVIASLKEQRIPYEVRDNGRVIMAPAQQVHEIRMSMAAEGLPQGGGVGFELFDQTKLGMTEFAQNVNYQRALQGELTRTINRFEEIESSRVHIVMATQSLFIDREEPATASVVLRLRPNQRLADGQVQAIVHLLSSSVAGLAPDNVTVVDNQGKMLSKTGESSFLGVSTEQQEFKDRLERNLEQRVLSMLEAVLGPGKAVVRLASDLDFRKHEKTEERYYPDNQVIRSKRVLSERGGTPDSVQGLVGVTANIGETLEEEELVGGLTRSSLNQTVNYEIGRVTSHTADPLGNVSRLSVAVMIDGTYRMVEDAEGVAQLTYIPRTAEELQHLTSIVKRAVNFSETRGDEVEIVNLAFERPEMDPLAPPPGRLEQWLTLMRQYSAYLKYTFSILFVLLTFVFIVRPLIQWLTGGVHHESEIYQQLPKTVHELENEFADVPPERLKAWQAQQLAASDQNTTLEIMREWLQQPAPQQLNAES